MSKEAIHHPDSKPRPFLSPIPRLRIGSTLVTQRGVLFGLAVHSLQKVSF